MFIKGSLEQFLTINLLFAVLYLLCNNGWKWIVLSFPFSQVAKSSLVKGGNHLSHYELDIKEISC